MSTEVDCMKRFTKTHWLREFGLRAIPVDQRRQYIVRYKGTDIGTFIPDLHVFDKIIVNTKVIPKIGPRGKGQMLNHLKTTGLKLGLIMNFYHSRMEYQRAIN